MFVLQNITTLHCSKSFGFLDLIFKYERKLNKVGKFCVNMEFVTETLQVPKRNSLVLNTVYSSQLPLHYSMYNISEIQHLYLNFQVRAWNSCTSSSKQFHSIWRELHLFTKRKVMFSVMQPVTSEPINYNYICFWVTFHLIAPPYVFCVVTMAREYET